MSGSRQIIQGNLFQQRDGVFLTAGRYKSGPDDATKAIQVFDPHAEIRIKHGIEILNQSLEMGGLFMDLSGLFVGVDLEEDQGIRFSLARMAEVYQGAGFFLLDAFEHGMNPGHGLFPLSGPDFESRDEGDHGASPRKRYK